MNLAIDHFTGDRKFTANIEVPNTDELRSDMLSSMINMIMDRDETLLDIFTLLDKELSYDLSIIAREHDAQTLESFVMYDVGGLDTIIKVSWGATINRIEVYVYEPTTIDRKIKNMHASFHIHLEHEKAPRITTHRTNSKIAKDVNDALQHLIDDFNLSITEINLNGKE